MFEVGRVVKKTAGRESGKIGVVVDIIDRNTVLIDGDLKRRKSNIHHLVPLNHKLEIEKGASTEQVKKLLEYQKMIEKKKERKKVPKKERKKGAKPTRSRKQKAKPEGNEKKAPKKKKSEAEIVEDALPKV